MEKSPNDKGDLRYIIGSEKSLRDIISERDLMPLLKMAAGAGECVVKISDASGGIICEYGGPADKRETGMQRPLYIEGEPAGGIVLLGEDGTDSRLEKIADLLYDSITFLMDSNLKRMLTTEIHTTVLNQSYEELLETNRKLEISRKEYRELAENLELKVQERTLELKQALARLLQQEKMASIGQLAAGVAHEVNNPLGFVYSNLATLKRYADKFIEMLEFYRSAFKRQEFTREEIKTEQRKWEALKLDYVLSDVHDLIGQSLDGAERVRRIVADLKGFSHIDDVTVTVVDINAEIDRTLKVIAHEIPDTAEIYRNYNQLPGCCCNPALLCQVFLNIILNALQARREGLKLVISTKYVNGFIEITFADNGPGIPDTVINRIFEPFFTTKEVGSGIGMGLTVIHDIISSLKGAIDVESSPGKGATFKVLIPSGGGCNE